MNSWDNLSMAQRAEVIKLAVQNGIHDLDTIRGAYNEYAEGGSIHIDPSKKGTFTAAAKKHGMGVQEFASRVLANKENYSPAMVKKANFARNASKWHGYGGNLYDTGGPFSFYQRMLSEAQNMSRFGRKPSYEEALRQASERVEKEGKDYLTTSNDNTWVEGRNNKNKNEHLKERGVKGAKSHALWEQEHPNLTAWGNVLSAAPIAVASAPFVSGVGDALAGTAAGQAATSGLTWLANAAKATPWVANSLPWVEAGLNTLAATEGAKEVSEGNFTPMTALELSPLVPPAVGIGNNLYLPHLREHVFASKAPIGYGGIGKAAKEIAEGVLSGRRANIKNPTWFNSNSAKQLQDFAYVPDYIQGAEREQYLRDFGERALKARTDMWRMYNRLPQKYNTFSPSKRHPGAYTASEDIEALKWVPQPDERYYGVDFVNSVGGNTGKPTVTELGRGIPDEGEISKKFGVTTVSDLWDLHPFSRPDDRIISRLQRTWNKAVRRPLNKIGDKIWKMSGNHLYDANEIKEYIDANKNDEFAMEMFDPDMFPRVGIRRKIGELLRKEAENIRHDAKVPKFDFLKPIDKKVADFEIGRLINGRPIMVKNDVPWTADTRIISTPEKDADFVTTYTQGFNSDNLFPSEVDDWRKGINRVNINDLNNWVTNDVLKGITKLKKNKHGLD